jgi:hypothetical protein
LLPAVGPTSDAQRPMWVSLDSSGAWRVIIQASHCLGERCAPAAKCLDFLVPLEGLEPTTPSLRRLVTLQRKPKDFNQLRCRRGRQPPPTQSPPIVSGDRRVDLAEPKCLWSSGQALRDLLRTHLRIPHASATSRTEGGGEPTAECLRRFCQLSGRGLKASLVVSR